MIQESVARRLALRLFPALALVLLGGFPATRAYGQAQATTIIQLESPTSDAPHSTRLMVAGWAADPSGDGAGVDTVRVYLGDPHADGQDLGAATHGQPRPDVARTLGDNRFTNAGFQLAVELPPGDYSLTVYAHRNTAGRDEGWAVQTVSFSASASVRPDPRAVALLGGDQPQVRTAAPSSTGPSGSPGATIMGGGGRAGNSETPFTVTNDGGAIRTTVSNRNDPIPLDPIIPGASTVQSAGRAGAELVDATGSGAGIRTSVASDTVGAGSSSSGPYRTGAVTMTGGGGSSCPGPNCPANTANMNQQMQNMTPDMLRQITGYNIPGFGNDVPCVPSNTPGGCNPITGSSQAPGAMTGIQQLQRQQQQAMQTAANQPTVQSPTGSGPVCLQYGANGQCATQTGAAGPLGSTCLRFTGGQCSYYGQAPAPASAAPGQAPGAPGTTLATANPLQTTAQGGSGCAQWGGGGQCLQPASAGGARNDGFVPGLAMTYPAGVLSPAGGATSAVGGAGAALGGVTSVPITTTSPTSVMQSSTTAVAGALNPTAASPYGTMPLPSAPGGSGICLQFGAGGACVRAQ